MSDPNKKKETATELTDEELEGVAAGTAIDTLHPSPRAPKKKVGGSIAQGDTLDNTLTDNNLP